MLTVADVANYYGASNAFVLRALGQIGVAAQRPESPVPDHAVNAFEKAFGAKIRAARPTGVDTADVAPVWKPRPHLMRIARERYTGKKLGGFVEPALLDEPGTLHAIDAAGTRDGDKWHGKEEPGACHFFGPSGPPAACGKRVKVVLGDRFDPERGTPNLCPGCVTLVAADRGFRDAPRDREYRSYSCEGHLPVKIDGRVRVQECCLREDHRGPHRSRDGAKWDLGFDDFEPAPLDASRRITKAS